MRRLADAVPGPRAFQMFLAVVALIVAVVLLVMFYDWLGATFLDLGGAAG